MGLGFDNGQQTSAINACWSVWRLKHRAWLMMGFGHYSLSLFSLLASAQRGEGDLQDSRGKISLGFAALFDVCSLATISILLIHLIASGCR